VTYRNARDFWAPWQTALIVFLIAVGAPLWAWRMAAFLRRRAYAPLDVELLFNAFITAVDSLSFALAGVLLVISLYWLIVVKLQQDVQALMVSNAELDNWKITVICAVIGQALGLSWTFWQQINVDVVFIDWEKPRRVLAKSGAREEAAPVSCWRTLIVANEWNELQTARMTSTPLTLLLLVFVLEGAASSRAPLLASTRRGFSQSIKTTSTLICCQKVQDRPSAWPMTAQMTVIFQLSSSPLVTISACTSCCSLTTISQ